MASAVNALSNLTSSGAPSQSSQTSSTTDPAPTEQMFLQLLVAQMKNQDPTAPQDPTQFVTQLSQFSEVEQLVAIRADADKVAGVSQNNGAGTGQTNSTGQTTNSNTTQTTTTQP
jgi:flagellar basal-body rod modification protein FlgD